MRNEAASDPPKAATIATTVFRNGEHLSRNLLAWPSPVVLSAELGAASRCLKTTQTTMVRLLLMGAISAAMLTLFASFSTRSFGCGIGHYN